MKYKYLLFDADNTLYDFNKCEREALRLALENSPLIFSDELCAKYHEINDGFWKKLEKGLITRDALKVERYKKLFEAYNIFDGYEECAKRYEKNLAEQRFETDGVWELLGELSENFEIYVVTNGLTSVQKGRFKSSRLIKYIKKLYISEEMGAAKPSPVFFDNVIKDIGDAERGRYIVIGDSLSSDIDGAINSGLDCIWYCPNGGSCMGRKITYTVRNINDVKNILLSQSLPQDISHK